MAARTEAKETGVLPDCSYDSSFDDIAVCIDDVYDILQHRFCNESNSCLVKSNHRLTTETWNTHELSAGDDESANTSVLC